jgi:esterase/lipase superfamily enzyme
VLDDAMPVRRPLLLFLALLVMSGSGCTQRYLTSTPNLLHSQDPTVVYAACPEGCRRPDMEVLYATDRAPIDPINKLAYGANRSQTLAFGTAVVDLTPRLGWKDLVQDSTVADRRNSYALQLGQCKELGRFDQLATCRPPTGNGIQLASHVEEDTEQEQKLHALLIPRLVETAHKDVFIYVHGVDNTFEDGVFRSAEMWHFLGRVGVPICYSWPSSSNGVLTYAYDRESGEFTVTHLKQFLKAVASCPGVERVHLIAHSRGTDVAITALRELHIACQAAGRKTADVYKIENLVLAAPDLDKEVFVQRFVAEDLLSASRRTTIYASRRDYALELADLVFGGRKRVGALAPRDFSPQVRQVLAKLPQLQFIECKPTRFWSINHDYIFADPAALSDLILVLRDRRPPGAENGRPLSQPVEGIWELTTNYPGRPVLLR